MKSAERLEPSTAAQTSIRSAEKPRGSPPTKHSKTGHLFGVVGNHGMGLSSVSGAFPMMHLSSAPARSEFGGLGTLGMSVSLAARSHLTALPDWWHSADAQGQGSTVLFPHLLGLPALFGMPSINQEQNIIRSRSPSRNGCSPAKGLNGFINGKGRLSSASSTPSPVLTASDQTRCPRPDINQLEEKSRHKTNDKKPHRKLPDVSINTDSQSESTSDSLSDSLDSSDSDDLDDDDDEDNQTDDSVESECGKDRKVMKKGETQTDKKKNHQTAVEDAQDHCSFSSHPLNPHIFQVLRPSEEPKHTSVIQTTCLSASTDPAERVTQLHKGREILSPKSLSSSSPKPVSLTTSPKPSLASSPKTLRLQSDHLKSCRNYLNETQLNFSKLKQPFLPQEPSGVQMKTSPASLNLTLVSQSSPKSQSSFYHEHSNLFLPFLPMESHRTNSVQDVPLALITKPRSHNPDKPLMTFTSSFNTPINLSTTGALVETGRTSTSPALTSGANGAKGCKPGRRGVKRERPAVVDHFSGAESDLASSNDTDGSLMDEENNNDVSDDSLSDSDSSLDSDSDDDDDGKHEDVETDTEAERTNLKHIKPLSSVLDVSSSRTISPAPLNLQILTTPGVPVSRKPANHSLPFTSDSVATPSGKRRRVTDETALRKPLEYGWQRETRITNTCGRLRGVVVYYAPCGRRIKQYPDVMKYLNKHGISDITRDHFSFSAKIKVGDFYEARDGPQGSQWYLLKEEEVVGHILAMEGRRGRLRNPECLGDPAVNPSQSVRRVRGGDESEADGLSVSEIKLLRRLEAQEVARRAAQMKLIRKLEKQALARAAKEARRHQAIMQAEERRKQKEHMKILKQQEKMKRIQQIRMEKELRARQILEAKRKKKEEAANAKILEAERRLKEKELRRQQAVVLKLQELERHRLDMERERRRQHVMLMKTMEARKKAEEKERVKQEKRDEKERRLELRRMELEMNRELNKPNEDMCLSDHKPLPALSRVPGLVLPGRCLSDCLMVMEFLRCFGKVLGFDMNSEVPSLAVLQAGLLNVRDHVNFIQDLLVQMLSAAVCDPGLPPGYRAKTALGDHVTNVRLNRDNVSEVLQIYMEAHCGQTELKPLAESLKTKAFQTHTPSQKASILAFLVNELTCSKSVISKIDKNIDSMTSLRRDKRLIEGNLRKLKRVYSKMTGKRESRGGVEEHQTLGMSVTSHKRKRKAGESDDEEEEDDEDSDEQGEEDEDYGGRRGKKANVCEDEDEGDHTTTIEELEKQIEKLSKQQSQVRQKLFEASQSLRSVMFGQDRYKRRYWVLPQCAGVFVEAMESGEGPEELQREREKLKNTYLIQVKEEPLETPEEKPSNAKSDVKPEPSSPKPQHDLDSLNLFLQKPGSFSKLSKLLKVTKMSDESQNSSPKKHTTLPRSPSAAPNPDVQPGAFSPAHQHLHHDQLYKVLTERNAHWFSLLPRSPCECPTTLPCSASSSSSPQTFSGWVQSSSDTSTTSTCVSTDAYTAAGINNFSLAALRMKSSVSVTDLPFCMWSSGNVASSKVSVLNGLHPSTEDNLFLPEEKPLSTPSPAIEVSKHQDYPSPQPIPEEMLSGWWRVTDIHELRSIEKACHFRGVREKVLQKQLQKHMDYITQLCAKNRDVTVINVSELEEHQISEDTVHSWCVDEQVMDVDISVLQQVEELEHRVTSASLQVKGWTPPAAQSHSEHLMYHEHKPVVVDNRSDCDIMRRANNPLDIAVMRLGDLERNIKRQNLKSPLSSSGHRLGHMGTVMVPASASSPAGADGDGADEDLSPGVKQWRKALGEVRSSSQLSLCIQQLHKSITWEKSIMKEASSQSLKSRKPSNRSAGELKKISEVKRNGRASVTSEDDSGRAGSSPSKVTNEMKKRKIEDSSTGQAESPAFVKKPITARDDSKDVTMCRMLLAELESHQDAWPFLRPVDPKSVPGYRKVIRKPMDFSTIRDKLTNSQYLNLETFIIDVNLVFDNCEKFNEDHSDIGRAGHAMRRFFQGRWTELLRQNSLTRDLPLVS